MALKLYSQDKDKSFSMKSVEDEIKLINLQVTLERDTGHVFIGLSLTGCISRCLELSHANRAIKIQKDFKISDKQFNWIKVKSLINAHNWDGLEKFSRANSKFSVGGIIEQLIKDGFIVQAKRYIEQLGVNEKDAQMAQKYTQVIQNFSN